MYVLKTLLDFEDKDLSYSIFNTNIKVNNLFLENDIVLTDLCPIFSRFEKGEIVKSLKNIKSTF